MMMRISDCKVYTLLCIVSLLVMLSILILHGHRYDRLREVAPNGRSSQSNRLKTVEHSIDIMDTNQAKYTSGRLDRRQMKRDTGQCSQERLDTLLRSCEEAASFIPTSGSGNSPPLFCGPNCSHLAIAYAIECSGQELLVNISGACKLESESSNITIECIYAVVIVKQGITSCTKMLQNVESTHEDLDLNDSTAFVEEKCCSLQAAYECDVIHDIHIDRDTGRLVTDPPLVPPWLRTDAYQPVQDVLLVCSESIEDPDTSTRVQLPPTNTLNTDIAEDLTTASGTINYVTHWSCITIIAVLLLCI